MNEKQKRVLLAWIVAILALGVFYVPYTYTCPPFGLFSVSGEGTFYAPLFRQQLAGPFAGSCTTRLDVTRLLLTLGLVSVLSGGLLLYFKDPESE